jgi:iron complex outermembrane receptor protein
VHHGTATFEIGDPDLTSERSLGLDATLRQHGPRTHLEASAYVTRFQDFIYLYPDPEPTTTIRGAFPTFRYTQADARLIGADLLFEYEAFRFLVLRTTASVVRGDNRESGDPLINMPVDQAEVATVWRLPNAGVLHGPELELTGRFVRRQTRFVEDVDYADPPPGYALYQAAASTEVHVGATPVHLSLAVYNLFDTSYRDYLSRYRYFIDDPGRSFVLRMQIPIGRIPDTTPHAD